MNSNFAQLVKEMRDAQKEYFKHRTQSALSRSKELERKVDEELNRLVGNSQQLGIF